MLLLLSLVIFSLLLASIVRDSILKQAFQTFSALKITFYFRKSTLNDSYETSVQAFTLNFHLV